MKRIFFMERVLEILNSGKIFKKVYSVLLKITAIFVILGGALLWLFNWGTFSRLGSLRYYYSNVTFVGVVIQILLLISIYCIVHILWIRSRTITELPETGYIITPIFSVTLRLLGEVLACVFAFSAVAGGLSIWIAGGNIMRDLGIYYMPNMGMAGFFAGLLTIVFGLFIAFILLMGFYYSAELSVVLVDIAANTKALIKPSKENSEDVNTEEAI